MAEATSVGMEELLFVLHGVFLWGAVLTGDGCIHTRADGVCTNVEHTKPSRPLLILSRQREADQQQQPHTP